MKAAYIIAHGGTEVLEYGDMPNPVAKVDQVLVDIHAASVNGADWKVREGKTNQLTSFPYILGRDFSGVICTVGSQVTDLKVGDAVFGVCPRDHEAAYAEKIAINANMVALKPDAISHVEMASVSLIGLTALVSIEDELQLKSGETILIQGGAGGVASFAIQLAKHIGADVITTASAKNHPYIESLGADQIIDYRNQDFTHIGRVCDAVFETVGGETALQSFKVLKKGGRAAFIASGKQPPKAPSVDYTSIRPQVGRSRAHLEKIAALVDQAIVKLPEITQFSLSEVVKAHEISQSQHLRGKLTFKIK